jgi:hypothetical protein
MGRTVRGLAALLVALGGNAAAEQPSPASFAGSWMGHWLYGPRQMMLIEDLANGRVRLTYSSGSMDRRGGPREGGQGIVEGILAEDGSLHVLYVNGAQVVLRLSADGSLSGEYVSETHRYVGQFNRQQ